MCADIICAQIDYDNQLPVGELLDVLIRVGIPQRITPYSSWVGHIPFSFALIDALLPRSIVELGTFAGDSYCGFCQAVQKLKLNTRCWAIDTWQGDEHGGRYSEQVLRGLREHHDSRYGMFSELVVSTFDGALRRFQDGSIDLLHIDGLHTYEAVRQDFETWRPKMSSRGVVLFHDIAVKRDDFGVFRYWEEVRQLGPYCEFDHSKGLGVLLIGNDPPPRVQHLIRGVRDDTGIRQKFEYFGALLWQTRDARRVCDEQAQRLGNIERSWSWKLAKSIAAATRFFRIAK